MKTYESVLPAQRKYLLECARRKFGIVLNEAEFLKSNTLSFYKLGDASHKEIHRFDSWDGVYDLVYLNQTKKKPDWRDGMRILHAAGEH